jgi:hypothetical protein
MKCVTTGAVCGCAVAVLAFLAEARGVEPSFRESLRRYIGHRNDAVGQDPPRGFPTDAVHVVALEYAVQLRRNGLDEAVDPDRYRFQAGDQIRVRIQPFNDLYIYVFFEDEQGCRRCLLPSDKNAPRLAKHDQPIELPTDGTVFEFEAGSKRETLVIVASKEPDNELTTLCEAVCKKRDTTLTPEERITQTDLRGRNEKILSAIQHRQSMAVAFRGRLSSGTLSQVSSEMDDRAIADAFLLEPPGNSQPSTLVMLVSRSETAPKIAVRIPLRSAKAATTSAP